MPKLSLFTSTINILDASLMIAALIAGTFLSAEPSRVEALAVHLQTASLFAFTARACLLSTFLGLYLIFFLLNVSLGSIFERIGNFRN